ncbi:uncharacterized protein PITG_04096 [Phytophthora infestans T30-4]|uniref:Uncharacterized protein n=1 Tax=Phytophthora infestans (strain T30-4) TaxID=403677 RepID=D0N0J6_PHYIT|nr:uncharacterized protein PITG_04096 [Phytophthora infestans T30-4]EEY67159.1 hypothetical protein PITG_04096 [Phytophthora infestans T30-4]|eukprot:XP_002905807.1 hypothetical protein PITG_04096 [Phytophthora infestans T30-4]
MRRLSGYDGEERDRLVREHREYIAGTRDRDADFGNGDGATLPAPPPPPTTGRRPRMTVLIKPKVPLKKQKKERRIPRSQGQKESVPCPSSMKAYHRWMGGVDVHDQLRLHRYSLQLSLRFRKICPAAGAGFLFAILFVRVGVSPVTPSGGDATSSEGYSLAMDEDYCKLYLCDKARQGNYPANTRTCYAIWHDLWRNGRDRPKPRCGRGIQMRPPGKKAGNAGEASTEGGAASEGQFFTLALEAQCLNLIHAPLMLPRTPWRFTISPILSDTYTATAQLSSDAPSSDVWSHVRDRRVHRGDDPRPSSRPSDIPAIVCAIIPHDMEGVEPSLRFFGGGKFSGGTTDTCAAGRKYTCANPKGTNDLHAHRRHAQRRHGFTTQVSSAQTLGFHPQLVPLLCIPQSQRAISHRHSAIPVPRRDDLEKPMRHAMFELIRGTRMPLKPFTEPVRCQSRTAFQPNNALQPDTLLAHCQGYDHVDDLLRIASEGSRPISSSKWPSTSRPPIITRAPTASAFSCFGVTTKAKTVVIDLSVAFVWTGIFGKYIILGVATDDKFTRWRSTLKAVGLVFSKNAASHIPVYEDTIADAGSRRWQVYIFSDFIIDAREHGLGSSRSAQSSTTMYALLYIRYFCNAAGHDCHVGHPKVRALLRGVRKIQHPLAKKNVSVAVQPRGPLLAGQEQNPHRRTVLASRLHPTRVAGSTKLRSM